MKTVFLALIAAPVFTLPHFGSAFAPSPRFGNLDASSVGSWSLSRRNPRTFGGTKLKAGLDSFDVGSAVLLGHGAGGAHAHAHAAAEVVLDGPLDVLAHSATLWSIAVMLSIVTLLYSWEEAVKSLRKALPKALLPVIDSMLSEMSGLGFIGLFLAAFVTGGALGGVVGELSEKFLGEEEVLLETFEFLHTAFFEVGIGFFVVSAVIVGGVLQKIQQITEVSELALDTDGDGEVSLEELADALHVQSLVVDADGDGFLSEQEITDALRASKKNGLVDEIFMTNEEICAETLVVRERFIAQNELSDTFEIERYFEQIFAHNLEEIVELSPLTWLPLIPFVALANSVDLSHEVISASSQNAAETAGWFIATPWFFYPSIILQAVCLAWGLSNFWKTASVKTMLLPTLVRDGSDEGPARLLPPRFEDKMLRDSFNSSPSIIGAIERRFAKPARNDHESLWGVAGAAGPNLYRDSIKFNIWLCVAQIVFYGGQVVLRDLYAEVGHLEVGNPSGLIAETAVYGVCTALSVAQLFLAPTTFLNYCLATSVEDLTKGWALDIAKEIDAKNQAQIIPAQAKAEEAPTVPNGQQAEIPAVTAAVVPPQAQADEAPVSRNGEQVEMPVAPPQAQIGEAPKSPNAELAETAVVPAEAKTEETPESPNAEEVEMTAVPDERETEDAPMVEDAPKATNGEQPEMPAAVVPAQAKAEEISNVPNAQQPEMAATSDATIPPQEEAPKVTNGEQAETPAAVVPVQAQDEEIPNVPNVQEPEMTAAPDATVPPLEHVSPNDVPNREEAEIATAPVTPDEILSEAVDVADVATEALPQDMNPLAAMGFSSKTSTSRNPTPVEADQTVPTGDGAEEYMTSRSALFRKDPLESE